MKIEKTHFPSQVLYKGKEQAVKPQLLPARMPYLEMYEKLIHFFETGKGQFLNVKA